MQAFDFEIHGKVQGVFFRKFTQEKASQLSVCGWVMNTPTGTVKGYAEGSQAALDQFATWLRTTGSPKSRIDAADISPYRPLTAKSATAFVVRK